MAEIRPFRGVRYDLQKTADLSKVICPPYDVISPQQQDELYQSSPYNFVRIEYNRELPQDNQHDNRYIRAANNIAQWLQEGILHQDSRPAFYLHEHSFTCQTRSYQRLDILAAVKLEEWDTQIVRPHENIIPRAKSDRMSMLYACQGNTSQVLAMYSDARGVIKSVVESFRQATPAADFVDSRGESHRLWVIARPEAVQTIQKEIGRQPLYIADGHHRYDSALTFKREKAAQSGYNPEAGYNYVMTSLIDTADPGLVILPTHRLVRGIPAVLLHNLKSSLTAFFEIRELELAAKKVWLEVDSCLTGLTPEKQQVSLAVYGLEAGRICILTLKDEKMTGSLMPAFHSELYKKLDVSLVDYIILEKLLGYDKDKEDILLAYTHNRQESVDRVDNQEYQLSFILNPVSPEVIKQIADAGDRMPRKSTYFYPKTPAGLVFYKW